MRGVGASEVLPLQRGGRGGQVLPILSWWGGGGGGGAQQVWGNSNPGVLAKILAYTH